MSLTFEPADVVGPAVGVGGHGVCVNPADALNDAAWVGAHPGEAALLVGHIEAAAALAVQTSAALIFSGGMTRRQAGPVSEAESYLAVAEAHDWFGRPRPRAVLLEAFARDSLENVTLSLARYRAETGQYPRSLTMVGWSFKGPRYRAHAAAVEAWLLARGLVLPAGWFAYDGVNLPPTAAARARAAAGEGEKLAEVVRDPLLRGPRWRRQRAARDPFGRRPPYPAVGPELPDLDALPAGAMPDGGAAG